MNRGRIWLFSASLANLLFLYLPIAVLIVFSFNASRLSATWQGFTFRWYLMLVEDQALLGAVENSLFVAVVSTFMATMLGISAAVGMERLPARRRGTVEGALLLPLVIPEVMMGVALLLFFVMMELPLSLVTVTIGHVVWNVPIVAVIVRAKLQKLDSRLLEAALDLGATPWRAFQRVTLPLLMPAVIGAVLMAFALSLDDFIVTFFTAGPGSTTLPLKVYSMVKSGVTPEINALSAILVLISMALIGLSLVFQRQRS
ncbi:MAG TPA: ABC transporter permease [Nitrospiraceae bacterium]|nr:ABC transporter permease [Nitrospiraceae bacterium]